MIALRSVKIKTTFTVVHSLLLPLAGTDGSSLLSWLLGLLKIDVDPNEELNAKEVGLLGLVPAVQEDKEDDVVRGLGSFDSVELDDTFTDDVDEEVVITDDSDELVYDTVDFTVFEALDEKVFSMVALEDEFLRFSNFFNGGF